MEILTFIFLFIANLLDTLLNHLLGSKENREMVLNVHKNNKCVANLDEVLGVQACHDGFCDLEMPLVTNVTEVLKPNVIVIRTLDE